MATPVTSPRSLPRQVAFAGVSSFGVLGVNLATGVIVARVLSPSGRGATAALGSFALVLGWLAAFGTNEGVNYVVATRPHESRRAVGTCLVLIAALGTIGVLVAQLLLPVAFSAQTDAVRNVGQLFVFTVFIGVANTLLQSILSGNQDFASTNVIRILQPALYLVGLLTLWASGRLTVGTTLASGAASLLLVLLFTVLRVVSTIGVGRPSLTLAREVGRYGLRAQGLILGGLGNTRLDLIIMPSILAAAPIGLYSVAVNTTSVLTMLAGAVGSFVLPVAARRGGRAGTELVGKMLRMVTIVGVGFGAPLFILAPYALGIVYGHEYVAATNAVRILLPGVLFAMGSRVTERALQAQNRPFAAGIGQLVALVITVTGLLVTLQPYGIIGAAGVSSLAYTIAFLISIVLLQRGEDFSLKEIFSASSLRADAVRIQRMVASRRKGSSTAAGSGRDVA